MNTRTPLDRFARPGATVVVLLALSSLLQGCLLAAAGAGAAAVLYTKGDLEAELDSRPDEVVAATESAFAHLGIPLDSSAQTGVDGLVRGHLASDREVTVRIEALGGGGSHLSIRVGTLGDEEVSQEILDAIRRML